MNENKFDNLIDYLREENPLSVLQICDYLDNYDVEYVSRQLEQMEKEGLLIKTPKKQKYTVPEKLGFKVGILLMNQKGFGFVKTDIADEKDIFIAKKDIGSAMDKDKVMIKITKEGSNDTKQEGEVVKVIQRNLTTVIGRYQKQKDFGFVIPLSRKITNDIYIPKKYGTFSKEGDMVECEIISYPKDGKKAEGRIIKVIANKNEKDVYLKALFEEHKLSDTFPNKVLKQLEKIPQEVSAKGRLDLREEFVFTIDGWDSKDLDDAISIVKTDKGYKLGVHIADVSEYVKENSALDSEAFNRGTSIYLVDTVVPMLPEKLSNGLCSLHPNVDRLTLSCIMNINENGKVIDSVIKKSIINSKARLVYKKVSDFLENINEEVLNQGEILREKLTIAKELSDILRKNRFKNGSMDFNFPESDIEMDENKNVIDVRQSERRIGNKIIEEFMIITNKTIAEQFFFSNIPFIYRIHENPDVDKLKKLTPILEMYNHKLKINDNVHPGQLQSLLEELSGKKEEEVISTLILRALKKAEYSSLNLGHFSLALEHYCHFTSPIRRYPDLIIHRIIKEFLDGKIDSKRALYLEKVVENSSIQSSQMEIKADEVQRDVEDLRKTQYMEKYVSHTFDAVISSITNFGMFARLENTIEGLIRYVDMKDDMYDVDNTNFLAIGRTTGKKYAIGDSIKIKVARTSIQNREIDFIIV